MQKIKNLLHHNADANHNGIPDSQERLGTTSTSAHRDPIVHDHGTTIPNTLVPPNMAATTTTTTSSALPLAGGLNNDRNMNGIPDNLEGGSARHNPLDKNMDGKVGLSDFLPGAKRQAALNDRNGNGIPDSQERLGGMSNDLNGNGIPDSLERNRLGGLSNDRNMNGIPDSQERLGGMGNDLNGNGIPDNLEGGRRHNPLDKNMDGKVGLSDFLPGAKRQAALNDRNGNGIPDSQERLGGMSNDLNGNGIPDSLERNRLGGFSNDRNMNGIPDNLERTQLGGLNDRNGNGIPDNLERNRLGGMNDRNMNGIPDNLEYSSSSSYGSVASQTYLRSEPTVVQVVEKGVVVHEHIHPVEKEEIQPIIYREREQMEVKQITQQLHETQIQPTLIQQRELAAEVRAPIVERGAPIQENLVLPSVDRDATMRSVQVNQAIVNETIKRTVIEEVQPVLERDVFVPTIVQQTQPIYEKIVEAPTVYREVLPTRELGTRTVESGFVHQAPLVREAPIVQPAPVQQNLIQPITVTTTTTTTDAFIPAKLVAQELKTFGANTGHAAPTGRKLH